MKNQKQNKIKISDRGYACYITTKVIDGFTIPPPLQILLIKEYCKNNNLLFSLPVEEFRFEGFYIELFGILNNCSELKGLIIPSINMIPKENEQMNYFFKLCADSNLEIHFIMESIIISSTYEEIKRIKTMIKIHELSKKHSINIANSLR